MPYSDKGYLDPLHIVWRTGEFDDPYVDRAEFLKVVNQTVVLAEIPDSIFRVRITGLQEVNFETITIRALEENQFSVNYSTGVIQVHKSKEGQSLNVVYKGRGFIQYPSNRIYHQDKFGDIVQSLDVIINTALDSVDILGKTINDKISNYEAIKELLLNTVDNIGVSTDNALIATEKANVATEKAKDAYNTTRLVFKPYVSTRGQISNTYPFPEVGWTVQVYDTGIRYRFDGVSWVAIDLFGGNIQPASLTVDGLMKKETFKQLQDLNKNYDDSQKEFKTLKDKTTERVVVFCFPYLNGGINSVYARLPFGGTITEVRGICSKEGNDIKTEIDIERSKDMLAWESIFFNSYLTFDVGKNYDNGKHIRSVTDVQENNLFRVNVKSVSDTVEGVTLEIKIKI